MCGSGVSLLFISIAISSQFGGRNVTEAQAAAMLVTLETIAGLLVGGLAVWFAVLAFGRRL